MQRHTKIYMDYYGYGIDDYIPCEICGKRATSIHHKEFRSHRFKDRDNINNLQALCTECHHKIHNCSKNNDVQ